MLSLGLLPLFCFVVGACAGGFQERRSVLSTIVVAVGFGWLQAGFVQGLAGSGWNAGAYVWLVGDAAICVAAGLFGHWLVARKRWRDAPKNH